MLVRKHTKVQNYSLHEYSINNLILRNNVEIKSRLHYELTQALKYLPLTLFDWHCNGFSKGAKSLLSSLNLQVRKSSYFANQQALEANSSSVKLILFNVEYCQIYLKILR